MNLIRRVRRLDLHQLLALVLAAVLVSLLLLIILTLDRGLDITDESLALLSYLHPSQYPANFSMCYTIVTRVTGWMHPTVIGYRWLTLVLRILTAVPFIWGLCYWLRRSLGKEASRAINPTLVFLFVLIGFLSVIPRMLNYNTVSSAFLCSSSGLLLYLLSRPPVPGVQPRGVLLAMFAVGFFSALDVFVKFSTAVIMFSGALLLVVLHMRRLGLRTVALAVAIMILGTIAGLAAYFAGVQSIPAWLSNYRAELRVVSAVSHKPGSIVRSYLQDGASLVLVLLRHFSFAFMATFVIARCYVRGWHRKARRNRYLLLALLTLTIIYTGYKIHALHLLNLPDFNHGATFYMYVLIVCFQGIVLLATCCTASLSPESKQLLTLPNSSLLLGIALLLALPFAGAIGTTNTIFLNVLMDIGAWFALILVLGLLIEERTRSRLALSLSILLPTCFGVAQLVYGLVWKPYLLPTTLPAQTIALQEPASVAGLKVDPATASFTAQLRSILHRASFQENDYILAFYNAPGLVLLMGGVSLGTPQYMGGEDLINCHALETVARDKRPVFILATRKIDPQTMACLQKVGLRFPDEFVNVGRVYNPYSASSYGWRRGERWVTVFRQNERR